MPKAKAKSKSSKVAEKVEAVKKSPPKPKKTTNPLEEIVSALDEDYNIVLAQARKNVARKKRCFVEQQTLRKNFQQLFRRFQLES